MIFSPAPTIPAVNQNGVAYETNYYLEGIDSAIWFSTANPKSPSINLSTGDLEFIINADDKNSQVGTYGYQVKACVKLENDLTAL